MECFIFLCCPSLLPHSALMLTFPSANFPSQPGACQLASGLSALFFTVRMFRLFRFCKLSFVIVFGIVMCSVASLFFIILVVLFARLLFYDPHPISPLVNARAHSRLEFLFAVYKTLLGGLFPIMYSSLSSSIAHSSPHFVCRSANQCSSLAFNLRNLSAYGLLVFPFFSHPLATVLPVKLVTPLLLSLLDSGILLSLSPIFLQTLDESVHNCSFCSLVCCYCPCIRVQWCRHRWSNEC